MSDKLGGGSLTALPIIETQLSDVSAYIPTNVISITDGQIFLENDLFYSGIRPAINVGISVSRVGSNAQIKAMKQVAGSLKIDLAQYREIAGFAKFGSDLDKATLAQLTRGERLVEILKQNQFKPMKFSNQIALIFAGTNGHLDEIPTAKIVQFAVEFDDYMEQEHSKILKAIDTEKELSDELNAELKKAVESFVDSFKLKEA